MAYEPLGTQKGDTKKTPTLRQYLKSVGESYPKTTAVTTIFKPSTYGGWSLICDSRFRVEILESNPLHDYLTEHCERLGNDETALFVRIVRPQSVEWSLEVNTDENSTWESKPWGYVLKIQDKKPTRNKTKTKEGTAQANMTGQ